MLDKLHCKVRKILKIKEEQEMVQPANKASDKVKSSIIKEADQTIKILNKVNRVMRTKNVVDNIYLVVKE